MRTVIVDDEPLARKRLRVMLAAHADVEIVSECEDAGAAVEAVREHLPALLFLDIQMPGATGFSVLEEARVTPSPFVVFVTAHAQHAVRAFDADAGDYLLKPFDAARLARTLERARAMVAQRAAPALATEVRALMHSIRESETTPRYRARVEVIIGTRVIWVPMSEVTWIEASGNYACFHVATSRHLVRTTLATLETELDPAHFARVHRSAIVRLDCVRELRVLPGADVRAVLSDGTVIPVSERYRARLRAFFSDSM